MKIADFGVSKTLLHKQTITNVGTPFYFSPELRDNKKYDFKSDIWLVKKFCFLKEIY